MKNLIAKLLLRLFTMALFFLFWWMLLNTGIHYSVLFLSSIKMQIGGTLPQEYFAFALSYLYTLPLGISQLFTVVPAVILSLCMTFKARRFMPRLLRREKDISGSSRWATSSEIKRYLTEVPESNVASAEQGGIVLARQGGNLYIDTATVNSMIIGTTRSGKGQTFVLPMIRMVTQAQKKQSLVVNDPKGELLENSYDMLTKAGYKVVALNFRDTAYSSLWNPLQLIIDEYISAMKTKEQDLSRTAELVGELARVITHDAHSDPIWPRSAKSLLTAMILYLLKIGYEKKSLDKLNLYSVYSFFLEFGGKNEPKEVNGAMVMVNALDELFRELETGDPAKLAYATSNFATGDMRSSIFSTLASNLEIFADTGIAKLTTGNQIDFADLVNPEKPCAIFMVVPDEKENRHVLASLFVNQCYSALVDMANTYPGQRLPQRVQFILDEFGNMVRIPSMDVKVTVSLGRNILFSLFVQDLKQLDAKYKDTAATIRSNCGNLIYINSLDKDTNEYISHVLGNKTIEYETYSGQLAAFIENHTSNHYQGRALMTADELYKMKFGEAVVIRQRCFPIHTKFQPFYKLGLPVTPIANIPTGHHQINLKDWLFPFEELCGDTSDEELDANEKAIQKANDATGGDFVNFLKAGEYEQCRRLIAFLQIQCQFPQEDIQILTGLVDDAAEQLDFA